jgi:cytochrome bd-type quinol oxidase subunit 1
MPGLIVPLTVFTLLYLVLGAVVVALIAGMVRDTAGEPAGDAREPLEAPA